MSRSEARDNGRTLESFAGEILLRCPRCEGMAVSRVVGAAGAGQGRQVVCTRCAFSRAHVAGDSAEQRFFGLDLYLAAECRHGTVWAYNPTHLAELRCWIEAPLRTRTRDDEQGWSNRSWLSRLPAWMKSARHRDEVLKAISELEARLSRT
jgi:hypothetical protein